ncbi:hypothetical protein ACVLV4_002721 [Rathayibacter agropyri]
MTTAGEAEAVLTEVRTRGDRAGELARAAAPLLLAGAEELYAGYRAALAAPESFARGRTRSESRDLVERSVRAEFAVALGVSERVAARELEHAQLLIEHLPRTRAALAGARLRWESGQVICSVAATLPPPARTALDERAAELAVSMTPTQLRRAVARLRDQLHEQPLAERHARAREDRAVWITPETDGMATLCAFLPAHVAVGAFDRLDRIARTLRDGAGSHGLGAAGSARDSSARNGCAGDGSPDERTLAQLRADALTDLLCDGDITGTTPAGGSERRVPTFVPGVRAEVRLTLPATTAVGLDSAPADLDGYGQIPADVARRLLPTASTLHRVLMDPHTGVVTSVGRAYRVPPREMRLHLHLRDRTCRFPGCTRPAATAEADHTVEWRHGGETSLDNLASLCVAHHHVRHGERWTYRLHPDGTADWTTPTGRRVSTHPATIREAPPAPRFTDPPPPKRAEAPPPF